MRLALTLLVPIGVGASPAKFAEFKVMFNKTYTSSSDEAKRAAIFQVNLETIQKLNAIERLAQPGLLGDVYGITPFMDLMPEEFAATRKGFHPAKSVHPMPPKTVTKPRVSNASGMLQRRDRLEGAGQAYSWCPKYCTPVKDQGGCGDCWAFSAVGEMESMGMIKGISVPALSPQQVSDCDSNDKGCDGGNYESGWQYAMSTPIESVADYPITGRNDACHSSGSGILEVTKVTDIDQTEQAMADCVTGNTEPAGPLSISVATGSWQFYTGGHKAGDVVSGDPGCNCISAATCGSEIDHAVQLTGYTVDSNNDIDTWEIRNQWGTDWGCDGFACLTAGENTCKLTSEPASVSVESASAVVVV